jgi:CarD family transcriptional regulator
MSTSYLDIFNHFEELHLKSSQDIFSASWPLETSNLQNAKIIQEYLEEFKQNILWESILSQRQWEDIRKTIDQVSIDQLQVQLDYLNKQYAVFCGYGIGQFQKIVNQAVSKQCPFFWEVKVEGKNITKILFPLQALTQKNLIEQIPLVRQLIHYSSIPMYLNWLRVSPIKLCAFPWNRRGRDYQNMLKSSCLFQMSLVLKELMIREKNKILSFGEKKMRDDCLERISQELALATRIRENLSNQSNSFELHHIDFIKECLDWSHFLQEFIQAHI